MNYFDRYIIFALFAEKDYNDIHIKFGVEKNYYIGNYIKTYLNTDILKVTEKLNEMKINFDFSLYLLEINGDEYYCIAVELDNINDTILFKLAYEGINVDT